jgi:hypothetical protein
MSITSVDNINLLSQLLYDHPLRSENPSGFGQFMNDQIIDIHKSRFKYDNNLTKMNKEVLRRFQNIINGEPMKHSDSAVEPVPKIKIFESKLKEQQDHFNSLIKVDIPDNIDFSDKTIESGECESVDETAQKRLDDLSEIMSSFNDKDKKTGEEWIKGSQTSDRVKTEKRVTFKVTDINGELDNVKRQVTDSLTDSFFSKLKPTKNGVVELDYSKYFIKIIENQTLIIGELVKLNSNS